MYMDLLELSRPELYPESIRIRALQMLVAQIASRCSTKLLEVLSNWPLVELQLLLCDIISRMDPIRQGYLQDPVVLEYQKYLSRWETHSLIPFLDFLSALTSLHSQVFPDILKAGVQDLLLHLYVSDFRDPMAARHKSSLIRKSSLAAACNSFLLEVCSDPSAREEFEHHPIHGLWPPRPMLLFGQNEVDRCSQRRQMWQSLGLEEIQWRISSAFDMLMDWDGSFTGPFLFDLLIDLLEFSGSAGLPDAISFRALRSLHCLSVRARSAKDQVGEWIRGLRMYFDQTPLDYAQDVFSRIIQQMLRLSLQDPAADSFYKFCCPIPRSLVT
ncbi:hypothetical protein BDP27DRAFT_1002416 [Rhodocollybia butyracea]|uniref:Uncharacterized protein n=1 Tax=Rhodocollybia butyracea TaxID=206335 RepID=A0A9P5PQ67_9AGAR|nr:hypothetical protein BDP27DRAFT_1002416 [Rhodocollybia butyracea]